LHVQQRTTDFDSDIEQEAQLTQKARQWTILGHSRSSIIVPIDTALMTSIVT